MYDEMLAVTGAGAIAIGGLRMEHWWIAAVGTGLMAVGVLVLRLRRRAARP
jgi:hypothetical protein